MITVEDKILEVLVGKTLSTYEVHKESGLAWSTVNMGLIKLKSEGKVTMIEEPFHIHRTRKMWTLDLIYGHYPKGAE